MAEENEKTEQVEPEKENPVPETRTPLDKAHEAADRLKEQNDRMEKLIIRQEALAVDNMLAGSAEAGQPPAKVEEESDEDYAKRVMRNDI